MTDSLSGELLCLILLILVCGRIFFTNHKNNITLAIISPVAFLLSIFLILANGFAIPEIIIFILSFFILFINIHAISRFVARLYVDRYRPAFYIFSTIFLILSILTTVLVVAFREVPVDASKYGVIEEKEVFENQENVLWTFSPETLDGTSDNNPVILFSADKKADTKRYRPYLILLAHAGYKVYSLDLYSSDIDLLPKAFELSFVRRSILIFYSIFDKAKYNELQRAFDKQVSLEYQTLLNIAKERNFSSTKCFLVGDSMQIDFLKNSSLLKNENILGSFNLTSATLYKTSGYGCITQTQPVLAYLMGVNREKTLIIPSYMVSQTVIAEKNSRQTLVEIE